MYDVCVVCLWCVCVHVHVCVCVLCLRCVCVHVHVHACGPQVDAEHVHVGHTQ